MKAENLERASSLSKQIIAIKKALKSVRILQDNVDQEEPSLGMHWGCIFDLNNTDFLVSLKGCFIGEEVLRSIKQILLDRQKEILNEVEHL